MKEGFVEFQGHLFDVTKWLEVRCNGPASCWGGGGERGIKYYQNLQEESVLVEERLFICHLK